LWFYVVNQGELSTGENAVEAQLSYINVPAELTVMGPDMVSVRLWGAFKETGPVEAYADLSGLGVGEHSVTVHVKPVKAALFTSVQPDTIKVRLDSIEERLVSISSEISQNPKGDYRVTDISVSPENCMVRGDQASIAKVATVVAPVQLGSVTELSIQQVSLQARDAQGNMVTEGIQLLPKTVDVYAAVEERKEIKQVPVTVVFQGELASDYQLGTVTTDPEEISVLASQEVLDQITQIETVPVDLEGQVTELIQVISLELPEATIASPSTVVVHIPIEKLNSEEVQE
jgi:YbbR domain-containing protein